MLLYRALEKPFDMGTTDLIRASGQRRRRKIQSNTDMTDIGNVVARYKKLHLKLPMTKVLIPVRPKLADTLLVLRLGLDQIGCILTALLAT